MLILRGPTPWAIILCQFSGQDAQPQTSQFFKDFFINPQTGGMFDYWRDISYGAISLEDSAVFGWFTLSYTAETDQPRTRFERIKAAIDDLKDDELKDVDFTRFYGIIVILNLSVDAGSVGIQQLTFGETKKGYGLMILGPAALNLSFAAHEMGHCYGLDHSFDTNSVSYDTSSDPRPGAYGDGWDIMSAMTFGNNMPVFQHLQFGSTGPGLNALNHDLLGWLPEEQVRDLDMTSRLDPVRVALAGLNQNTIPTNVGDFLYVAARIKHLASNLRWTVEYRRAAGFDAGIGRDGVLIHESRGGLSYLLAGNSGAQDLQADGVFTNQFFSVRVISLDTTRGLAFISVSPARRPTPPPSLRPCDMLRRAIKAQTRLITQLTLRLGHATSPEEIEDLEREIEFAARELDALNADFRARGCED